MVPITIACAASMNPNQCAVLQKPNCIGFLSSAPLWFFLGWAAPLVAQLALAFLVAQLALGNAGFCNVNHQILLATRVCFEIF